MKSGNIEQSYRLAQEQYAALGVDTEKALATLAAVPISLQCWQGDDLGGFESDAGLTGGGIQATGNYPGKARTPDELRADLQLALSHIPGKHRVNLHAIYGDFGGKAPPRDEITPAHFAAWIDWAKQNQLGLDFNPTCFSHPLANDGFTLASRDEAIRKFWVRHCQACRKIGEAFGRALASPCVTNVWIPDGYKDTPADRLTPRLLLQQSLDAIFAEDLDTRLNLDSVEGKLFGIGSESYVVGSHEFYLGYAVKNKKLLCIDSGHFHPTESVADKISSVLVHLDEVLLHVSRGVRWDSDHVVILSDELRAIAEELVRGSFLPSPTHPDRTPRVHIGLDYFDASINRVAAWVIGTRAMQKALLIALLEPQGIKGAEVDGDFTTRLALLEEYKSLPFGAVWQYHCTRAGVDPGMDWLKMVKDKERR